MKNCYFLFWASCKPRSLFQDKGIMEGKITLDFEGIWLKVPQHSPTIKVNLNNKNWGSKSNLNFSLRSKKKNKIVNQNIEIPVIYFTK